MFSVCGWSEGRPQNWVGQGSGETENVDEHSVEKVLFCFPFGPLCYFGDGVKDVFPYLKFFMQNPTFVSNIFCLILTL